MYVNFWLKLYLLQPSSSTYNTRSSSYILVKVLKAHKSLHRSSFQFAAASDWNELQQTLKFDSFISISSFKNSIIDTLTDSCGCFVWCIVYLLALCAVVCAQSCLYHVLCCYHVVLLPCYVVVLGLSLCSVVLTLLLWYVFCPIYLFIYLFIYYFTFIKKIYIYIYIYIYIHCSKKIKGTLKQHNVTVL